MTLMEAFLSGSLGGLIACVLVRPTRLWTAMSIAMIGGAIMTAIVGLIQWR